MQAGLPRHGWQRRATEPVRGLLVEGTVRPRLSPTEQALFRSQGGPLAGVPYMCFPTSRLSRMDSSLFRVLLLERLWVPLLHSSRICRCGRPLDPCGHHRAACAQAGVLARRGYALESAAARVCREAGVRVSTNVSVRDLDLLPLQHVDARRLEVVADGLPHEFIQSSLENTVELVWSSPVKWEADGLQRRKLSSVNSRGRSLVRNLPHSAPARNSHGPGGGA